MKTLIKLAVVLLVLCGGGAYVALRVFNAVSVEAVERSLGFIFQVDAQVAGASVSAKDSSLELTGLAMGNPEGYDEEHSFTFGRATATVDAGSIRSGRPGIRELVIHDPEITVEFEGKVTNLSKMIENASRFKATDPDNPATIPVYFEKVIVENPVAVFIAPVIGTPLRVSVPTIEINDIGTADEPVTAAEASALFARELLVAVTKKGAEKLPDSLAVPLVAESVKAAASTAIQDLKTKGSELLGGALDRLRGEDSPPDE